MIATTLNLKEIQGIILGGYDHLKTSRYLFLQIEDVTQVKEWLARISDLVITAAHWPKGPDGKPQKHQNCLNIAFTYEGLEKLGVPTEGFSVEFCQGMAGPSSPGPQTHADRSKRLGDTGANAPQNWEFGGPFNPPMHILLLLFASDEDGIEAFQAQIFPAADQAGLKVVAEQDTYRPKESREPFGFRDGISQPFIEGFDRGRKSNDTVQPVLKAGEFILGYRNEFGLFPPMPSAPQLGSNGSYLVYRKLEQDVVGFWNFMYKEAKGDPKTAEWLAAKFVGRWTSGAPLVLAPDEDNPMIGENLNQNNDFQFAKLDPFGYACPIGSHIRRTNPRDSLQPDPEASLDAVKKHRLIRRGRVYGPKYPAHVVKHLTELARQKGLLQFAEELVSPRGLAFVALNADLKRQFEFVQQTWVNDPTFEGLYTNRDPLLANDDDPISGTNRMTIQRRPIRKEVRCLPRFVTMRGGGYFFLPGMEGLKFIASTP
jgi:Dyp-type peroxidase family